jgi:hypothetical protein
MRVRTATTVIGLVGLTLSGWTTSAGATPPGCDGAIIQRSVLVSDQGALGVLDADDVFELRFRQSIDVLYAEFGVTFLGANGEADAVSDPNATSSETVTGKTLTVTIEPVDIGGGVNDIALPLPVTITEITGVFGKGSETGRPSISCSKDVVLD